MNKETFSKLPEWLKELWEVNPSIARVAEKQFIEREKLLEKISKVGDMPASYGLMHLGMYSSEAKELLNK